MMVALVIVVILTSFVIVQINSSINAGKDVKRKADIELLANAVVSYSADHYSSKPIASNCTIGGDCDSTIEDALKVYLPTLPVDPNSDTYYSYQSDGNDCTISATLSDNTVYLYSCDTKEFTLGTPIAGVCGSAETNYLPVESAFSGDYCSSGAVVSEPTFPEQGELVTWDCLGEYSGPTTTCTAYHGKDGVCGTVTTTTETAYLPTDTDWPSSDYCFVGTVETIPDFPLEGESTTWTCPAVYIGENDTCTAYRGENGVCGTSNGGDYYTSAEVTNPCAIGNVSTITTVLPATDYFKWTCSGVYTGSSSPQCTADLKVNGACGSASGSYYTTAPTANLCLAGNNTPVSGSGPWTWTCLGINGGIDSNTCTALKDVPPPIIYLIGGIHTTTQCAINVFGTVFETGSGKICKINGSSCPTGWTQYLSYSTTSPVSVEWGYSYCASYAAYCSWDACSTGSHAWSNIATESCTPPNNTCATCIWGVYGSWPGPGAHYATITQIGCY